MPPIEHQPSQPSSTKAAEITPLSSAESRGIASYYSRIEALFALMDSDPSLLPVLREALLKAEFYFITARSSVESNSVKLTRQPQQTLDKKNNNGSSIMLSLFCSENAAQEFSEGLGKPDYHDFKLFSLAQVVKALSEDNKKFSYLFHFEKKQIPISNEEMRSILFGEIYSSKDSIQLDLNTTFPLKSANGKEANREYIDFCSELNARLSKESNIKAAYLGMFKHPNKNENIIALFINSEVQNLPTLLLADLDYLIKNLPPGSAFNNCCICRISDEDQSTIISRGLIQVFPQ